MAKSKKVDILATVLDWRQAENLKEAQKPCVHTRGKKKLTCKACFVEYFKWRTQRN